MSDLLKITGNHITLEGFDGVNDFTISFLTEAVVIFPKYLEQKYPRYSYRDRNNIVDEDAVTAIKQFYDISETDFMLEFETVPPEGNYLCTLKKRR